MLLQYAIDSLTLEQGMAIAEKIRDYVDIIELGEGMIQRYSLSAVTKMKQAFPEKKILADLKIMDAGYNYAMDAYEVGADIVTACIVATEGTAKGLIDAAKDAGKESWLDFIAIPSENYADYVEYLNRLAPDYVCAHLGSDIYEKEGGADARARMFEKIGELNFSSKLVLSGGISLADIPAIKKVAPHHVNVGGAIEKAADPVAVARAFKEA